MVRRQHERNQRALLRTTSTTRPASPRASIRSRCWPCITTAWPRRTCCSKATTRARKFSDRTGAQTTDLIAGTVLLDRANNNTRFHSPTLCEVCDAERRNNDDVLLEVHDFLDAKSFGSHDLVAGVDRFTESRYANNHQSGSDFSHLRHAGAVEGWRDLSRHHPLERRRRRHFIRWTPILVAASQNDLRTDSAFINDTLERRRRA